MDNDLPLHKKSPINLFFLKTETGLASTSQNELLLWFVKQKIAGHNNINAPRPE